ncbi:hypothetical protein CYY_002450 [Polysphondylium violaceum]|uniref:Ankyrin repeat-containing protein n=1 Tax=Polysphondylium violaceum TaxID=133409 RepID=A0A8J4V2T6_9MYCE|nr:hypothetical protein CYY_002450 [Polysphondylium violaceum]
MNELFQKIYKNVFLKNKIFGYLGSQRKGYYLYSNSVIYHQYDDLQLHDIINTRNKVILLEKLNRYKSLFNNSNSNNSNSDNNRERSFTYYQDWLDYNSNSNKKKIDIEGLKGIFKDDNEIDSFLNDLYQLFLNENRNSLEYFPDLVFRTFGYTNKRRKIMGFNKTFSTHSKSGTLNTDLTRLFDTRYGALKNIQFRCYSLFIDDPFFLENKDRFRSLDFWNDNDFVYGLLKDYCTCCNSINSNGNNNNNNKLELFKWILSVSSFFNYDLYVQKYGSKGVSFTMMFGYKVVVYKDVEEMEQVPFIKSGFFLLEVFQYLSSFYPNLFNESVILELVMHQMIKIEDYQIAKAFVEYWPKQGGKFEHYPLESIFVISTHSSDMRLFELLRTHFPQYQVRNILSTRANIEHFLLHNPGIFEYYDLFSTTLPSDVDPFEIYKMIKPANTMSNNIILEAVKRGRIDFLEHCIDRIVTSLPLTGGKKTFMMCAYSYGHWNILDYLYKLWYSGANNGGNTLESDEMYKSLLYQSMSKYDLHNSIVFYNSIKDVNYQRQTTSALIVDVYMLLSSTTSRKEKDIVIEMVKFLKDACKQHNIHQLDSTNKPMVLQDIEYIRQQQFIVFRNTPSILDLFRESMVLGELNETKLALSLMTNDQHQRLTGSITSLIIAYLNQHRKPKLKVILYLFDRFQSTLAPHTFDLLAKICYIAMEFKNHHLIDILLHQTKIRLFKPVSPQHDHEMLCHNHHYLSVAPFKCDHFKNLVKRLHINTNKDAYQNKNTIVPDKDVILDFNITHQHNSFNKRQNYYI